MNDETKLERGTPVVWSLRHGKRTSGLSEKHRILDGRKTFCMDEIPADLSRLVDLRLPIHVEVCQRCEQRYASGADLSSAFKSLLDDVRSTAA